MKLPQKTLLIGGILGAVGVGALTGGSMVSAQSSDTANAGMDPMSSLVGKIASKFNLNKAEVQAVFDEQKTTMEAERETERAEKLQALVDAGTITAAQKKAIEAKMTAMRAERESDKDSFKDLTDEQRKTKMEENKSDLETWAKEQGIDLTKLDGILMGGGHGRGGPGGPEKLLPGSR